MLPAESPPRVLLADDHRRFLRGLAHLLSGGATVVGAVEDGGSLAAAVEESAPDVVIFDTSEVSEASGAVSGAATDGAEVTRRLLARSPETRVVILGPHTDGPRLCAAFRAGARGYVVKSAAAEELATAVGHVAAGRCYVSPAVTEHLVNALRATPPDGDTVAPPLASTPPDAAPHLTPRQREVLALVAAGRSNRRIAERLCISPATVRSHLSHLYATLGLENRVELALYAVHAGLVTAGGAGGAGTSRRRRRGG